MFSIKSTTLHLVLIKTGVHLTYPLCSTFIMEKWYQNNKQIFFIYKVHLPLIFQLDCEGRGLDKIYAEHTDSKLIH